MTKWEVENSLRDTIHRLFETIVTLRRLNRKTTNNDITDMLLGLSESLRVSHAHSLDVLEDVAVGTLDDILERED